MTVDEAKNAIQELKSQGLTDEGIAASLYQMFKEDKIDLDQFGALVKLVGYDLSEEFMAMSDDEKKNQDVGEFGMSDDGGEGDSEGNSENDTQDDSNDNSSNDNSSNEGSNEGSNDDEDENPFEKYDTKKDSSNDDEDEEFKKTYGF